MDVLNATMRLAIALSMAGWSLPTLATQTYGYQFGDNRYCGNYHDSLTGKILPGADREQCQLACDGLTQCNGFLMSCATDCYLMETCEDMQASSCSSYVGVKKISSKKVMESFLIDPWDSISSYLAVGIFSAVSFGACILAMALSRTRVSETGEDSRAASEEGAVKPSQKCTRPLSDFFASDPSSNRDDQASESWGDCFHEEWWRSRLLCCIIIAIMSLPILIAQMFFFPNDGHRPRGVCGVVHKDYTPYTFWELLPGNDIHDAHLLVNDTLYRSSTLRALPDSCVRVYSTRIVCWKTGPACHNWCKMIAGRLSFRFLCSAPTYGIGYIYMACNSVYVWEKIKMMPLSSSIFIALLYGCLSIAHAAWRAHHKICDLERNGVTEVTKAPSKSDFTVRLGEKTLGFTLLFSLAKCFPGLPTKSDAAVLKIQILTALGGFLASPVGDINGSLLFLLRGDFLASGFLMLVVVISSLHNPIQSDGTQACLMSLHRGFPTRDMYVLQVRHGASKGIFSLMLVVFLQMRGAYFHAFGTVWHFVGLTFMAATAIYSALPNAGAASVLLQMHCDPTDYNDCGLIEATKKKLYWMRLIPIIDGYGLAVAFGRSFNDLSFALYLWAIGFGIGAGGSRLYACYYRRKCPCQVMFAFVFWPFAPVRLIVLRSVWVNMTKGQASWCDVVSRGFASLPPRIFYVHRWLTLSIFWAFTVIRPDRNVYTDILRDIFTRYKMSMEQSSELTRLKIFLGAILIMGWVSLPLSMVLYWNFRDQLERAYNKVGDGAFDLVRPTHTYSEQLSYALTAGEEYTQLPEKSQGCEQELPQVNQPSLVACCTRSCRSSR